MSKSESSIPSSIPCSTFTYPRSDAWTLELYGLLNSCDTAPMAPIEKSEMMSPLPWPVTPYEEWESEREMLAMAEMASYNAKQYEKYGDDEELVKGLLCEETEVDIRLALWRWDRMDELEIEIKRFFELFENERFEDTLHLGWWLMEQYDNFGAWYDPVLLQLLKETISKAYENNRGCDSSAGLSVEIADL